LPLLQTLTALFVAAPQAKNGKAARHQAMKQLAFENVHTLFEKQRRQSVCRNLLTAWEHSPSSELSKFAKGLRKRINAEAKIYDIKIAEEVHTVAFEVISPKCNLDFKEGKTFGPLKRLYWTFSVFCQGVRDARLFHVAINVGIFIAAGMVGLQACDIGIKHGELSDLILNVMFTFELLCKIVAEFDKPWRFFDTGWNRLDFIIVVSVYTPAGGAVLLMRVIRLLRVLRVMRAIPDLEMLVTALMNSADSVCYVGLLLLIVFYAAAIFSMMFFRENDPWHFKDLHTTLMTLFRTATSEDWIDIMMIAQRGCEVYPSTGECTSPRAYGWWAVLFWVAFHMIGGLVFLNLFIGVVTVGMTDSMTEQALRSFSDMYIQNARHTRHMSKNATHAYCEAFRILDITAGDQLYADDLRWALDAVYLTPTDEQIEEMMAEANKVSEDEDKDPHSVSRSQFIMGMEVARVITAMPNRFDELAASGMVLPAEEEVDSSAPQEGGKKGLAKDLKVSDKSRIVI
jgi:voltage-gated sodium channel